MVRRKILFLQTEDSTFYSHRLPMARAALSTGAEVVVAVRVVAHRERLEREGLRVVALPWRRSGVNPFSEMRTLAAIVRLYAAERPDLVHQVTLKPILYGSLAAALAGVPAAVNALTGLGFIFISESWVARLLRLGAGLAMKAAFSRPGSVALFQNEDDRAVFLSRGLVARERTVLIRGSGVDTARFAPSPEAEGVPLVVLPARMLWDKGVGEFVEAARLLAAEGVKARFALIGEQDDENPAAVPPARLAEWKASGAVEWWGLRDDMAEIYARAHVVCLPSYREGLPKALMEAAACGRPVVGADVPGCREVVRDGETGLLVPARDARALASALGRLIADKPLRERLGAGGRRLAVAEFAQERIAEQTKAVYERLLAIRSTT
ncbi:MAG: glycosyltransferase family 4 protein [Elusimicrobia bacterium]|nr:glycosyltransferase family 4 protein [Elusimicrobiota bacterium]